MTMFYNRSPSHVEVATPFIQSLDWGLYPWRHSAYTAPAPTSPLLSSWDHPLAFTKYGVTDIDDKLSYMEQQIIRLHKWMDSVWREFGGEIDTEIRNFNKNHSQIQNQSKNKDHNNRWGINGTRTETEETETNTDKSTTNKLNSNTHSTNSILNSQRSLDSNSELKPAKTTFIPISVSETNSLNTNRTGTGTGTGTKISLPVRPEIVEIEESHAKNRQTQIQVQNQNQRKTYRLNVHLGSSFPPESVIVKVSLKNRVMTIAAKSEEKSETGDENDSTFSRVCREIIRKFTLPANLDLTEITSVMQPDGILIVEAPLPLSPEAEPEPKPKVTVLKFATEPEPKEKILTFETEPKPKLEPKEKLWKFESQCAPESKPKEREYENLLFRNNNTEPNRNSFKFDTDPEPERLPKVRVLNFETEPSTKPKDNLFRFNKDFIIKPEENNSFKFDSEPESDQEREPRVRILNFDTESESGVKITEITMDHDE